MKTINNHTNKTMKTSKKLSMAAFLLLALAACNKQEPDLVSGLHQTGECLLTTLFDAPTTKVQNQSAANEKAIQNVQIFVFRAGEGADKGVLDNAVSAGFHTPLGLTSGSYDGITLKCSTGAREVWAVVNDVQDHTVGEGAVQTKADFLALTHELENTGAGRLLMIGRSNPTSQDPAIQLVEGSMQLSIPVHRLAASIVLESVTNDFSAPAYRKLDQFRLDAAYLLNVPGRINFGESLAASALPTQMWYARLAAEKTNPRAAILYDSLGGTILPYGQSYNTPHTFYAYPNDCSPSEGASFSPRATLLVLEASVKYGSAWTKYYYPVVLDGGLQSNKQYRVNLTVHRPGSTDPNHPVAFSDLSPIVRVVDWTEGGNYLREI